MYLFQLADRISRGLHRLPQERLDGHRRFVVSQQDATGGFCGREGGADLYYSGFAVRALAVSGGLDRQVGERFSDYLRAIDPRALGVIDLLSWLYGALLVQVTFGWDLLPTDAEAFAGEVAVRLERSRTRDGGYAKSEEGAAGSTYQSFLVALTYELLGLRIPRPNALIQFLYDRQRDDGGFVEIAPMRRSGTNPTAAAVALLNRLGGMESDIGEDVLAFLQDVASPEGGFQANTRIPFGDGLSTFTGLLTAQDLGRRDLLRPEQLLDWVTSTLELPSGGFRGASWDRQADVEYSFYGLGILGLLFAD
ncbi:MAG: geranyl transferase [Planctomycetaceae bacterium]|nr:geranyl transferase [Planctomycetaceae bacterium]